MSGPYDRSKESDLAHGGGSSKDKGKGKAKPQLNGDGMPVQATDLKSLPKIAKGSPRLRSCSLTDAGPSNSGAKHAATTYDNAAARERDVRAAAAAARQPSAQTQPRASTSGGAPPARFYAEATGAAPSGSSSRDGGPSTFADRGVDSSHDRRTREAVSRMYTGSIDSMPNAGLSIKGLATASKPGKAKPRTGPKAKKQPQTVDLTLDDSEDEIVEDDEPAPARDGQGRGRGAASGEAYSEDELDTLPEQAVDRARREQRESRQAGSTPAAPARANGQAGTSDVRTTTGRKPKSPASTSTSNPLGRIHNRDSMFAPSVREIVVVAGDYAYSLDLASEGPFHLLSPSDTAGFAVRHQGTGQIAIAFQGDTGRRLEVRRAPRP